MKIQSRFKDYYDYISHLYGGGDPKVTYVREPLSSLNENGYRPDITIPDHQIDFSIMENRSYKTRFDEYNFKALVIMDRAFLCYQQKATTFHPPGKVVLYDWLLNSLRIEDHISTFLYDSSTRYPRGEKRQNVLELTKKVGAPVYVIERASKYRPGVVIQSEIPNLGNLGVASFYPAEQLYQDLAYFIGNTMKDNPDIKPPVEVDDMTRLQQYGFDKRYSFRHRK